MFEATLDKVAVQPDKGKTVLYATFNYLNEGCGVKAQFDWFNKNFKKEEFLQELKEAVAKELDIQVYKVSLDERRILERMEKWATKFAKMGFLINDGGLCTRGVREGFLH